MMAPICEDECPLVGLGTAGADDGVPSVEEVTRLGVWLLWAFDLTAVLEKAVILGEVGPLGKAEMLDKAVILGEL